MLIYSDRSFERILYYSCENALYISTAHLAEYKDNKTIYYKSMFGSIYRVMVYLYIASERYC